MRMGHWLFLVSAALFIVGVAFLVASTRTIDNRPAVEAVVTTPVASVLQIMRGIVAPAASVVFSSVGTTITASGTDERMPRTAEEWNAVGDSVAALAESGNLLMLDGRAIDKGDWMTMSRALMDGARGALKAIEAKDVEALFASGETINTSCDSCHERYQRQ
jgi:cytochrome c553